MKKMFKKLTAMLLALACVFSMAACGNDGQKATEPSKTVDPAALFNALLTQVGYGDTMSAVGESAPYLFPELPAYSQVTFYRSDSGYYADELVWITLTSASDAEAAKNSIQTHVAQLRDQFLSYIPEEVSKIDSHIIWTQGADLILVISSDAAGAQAVIDNAHNLEPLQTQGSSDPTDPNVTDTTEPETTEPETTEPETTVPSTTSPSVTNPDKPWRFMDACVIIGDTAFEYYNYSEPAANYYAKLVNKAATELEGITDVYCLVIPTAIGVVFPDDIRPIYTGTLEDQSARLDQIYAKMNDLVIEVNCFDNLMAHRDEYLYFRTDWHWNGPGAYYAYEVFCQMKGVTPYTMEQRQKMEFPGYLGGFYFNSTNQDAALKQNPDTVIAYKPYCTSATMKYTDKNGNTYSWPIINDVSNYAAAYKYGTFAAADQPYAVFTNPEVTDGSVCIVVKESFGNALMSYVVDHYSTVYEIDYRYWKGDLIQFAKDVGADDLLFANNIGMVRSSYLIGRLDEIV